ncbi:HIT family protein [Candidatus Puniceispirillum sp.]|jgi:diadenosine tetraphosphate (Ap4A) HIT family hydrolase|uniref:HIT family protein n=1 Tax=Candidatus Puniceispirillum sp. TaxID=2026719 RepID=UPI001EC3F10D|nr:HIT domain-containing protein [Candidatus Puniceispirillum sp.]MBT6565906.1 HIT domain-containing protein [Candidatus Puniceispirillum sp.]
MSFSLDKRLEADSLFITRHDDIQIRVMNDARYVWVLLVPEIANVTELHDLPSDKQQILMWLAASIGSDMKGNSLSSMPAITKINTALIGNMVSQLHLHIVGRHPDDEAWPAPVWGVGTAISLDEDGIDQRRQLVLNIVKTLREN